MFTALAILTPPRLFLCYLLLLGADHEPRTADDRAQARAGGSGCGDSGSGERIRFKGGDGTKAETLTKGRKNGHHVATSAGLLHSALSLLYLVELSVHR